MGKATIAKLHICQFSPVQLLLGKSGMLYICVVGWSVGHQAGDSSDITLAFKDAQGRGIFCGIVELFAKPGFTL